MFDFEELEEKEGQPLEEPSRPPGLPSPVRQAVAEPFADLPATPSAPSRPPGLPSPPRAQSPLLHLGLRHEVTMEELRGLTGAQLEAAVGSSPSLPPGALDSALKVDGHLLLLADDGTLAVYRRNGTAMLRLPFAEDRPKEVAWHPRNPKAFCTLHSACVRLWDLQLLQFQLASAASAAELCKASWAAEAPEPLLRMALGANGDLAAVAHRRLYRWSGLEDSAPPRMRACEDWPLQEELDGSQELRFLDDMHVVLVGKCQVCVCMLVPGALQLLQLLSFPVDIRCERRTGSFLALRLCCDQEDLVLQGSFDVVLKCLAAAAVEDRPPGLPSPQVAPQMAGQSAAAPPGLLLPEAPSTEEAEPSPAESEEPKKSMVDELSSFMQKRAQRASDALVEDVLQNLSSEGLATELLGSVELLEAPEPPADAQRLPRALARELRILEPPSKEQVVKVLTRDLAPQPSMSRVQRSSLTAVDSFMNEVTSQAMGEMKRLLQEVRSESGSGLVDACRRSVRRSLREKAPEPSKEAGKEALLKRLHARAQPLHQELDAMEAQLKAAGAALARRGSSRR